MVKKLKRLKRIKNRVADFKVYIQRSSSYVSIFNSVLLILVFLKVDDNFVLKRYTIPLILIWFLVLIFFGWAEINIFKVPQQESETTFKFQPPFVRMYENVEDIKKMLEEKKNEETN